MVFLDAIFQSQFVFLGATNGILCLHAYLNDWPYICSFFLGSSNPALSVTQLSCTIHAYSIIIKLLSFVGILFPSPAIARNGSKLQVGVTIYASFFPSSSWSAVLAGSFQASRGNEAVGGRHMAVRLCGGSSRRRAAAVEDRS